MFYFRRKEMSKIAITSDANIVKESVKTDIETAQMFSRQMVEDSDWYAFAQLEEQAAAPSSSSKEEVKVKVRR